jgi:hypothetical protein
MQHVMMYHIGVVLLLATRSTLYLAEATYSSTIVLSGNINTRCYMYIDRKLCIHIACEALIFLLLVTCGLCLH